MSRGSPALRLAVVGAVLTLACVPSGPEDWREWRELSTGMRFVRLDPGRFTMGSSTDVVGREAQETPHAVTLTRPFWLGAFEVTQGEWTAVMGTRPSWFQDGDDRLPVESVTRLDVDAFLAALNQRSPGNGFRLPTEAEWEYACRADAGAAGADGGAAGAGQGGAGEGVATGPPSTQVANVAATPEQAASGRTTRVGSFPANAWGLFDMRGNVWEWTADEHCPYPDAAVTDPVASCGAPLAVIRGGSWRFTADSARCALRYTHSPRDRGYSLGFRIVRQPPTR